MAMTAAEFLEFSGIDQRVKTMAMERMAADRAARVRTILGNMDPHAVIPAVELPFANGVFSFRLSEYGMVLLELGYPHPLDKEQVAAPPMRVGEAYARILRGRYQVDGEEVGLPGAADFSVVEINAIVRMALLGGGGGVVNGEAVDWKRHHVDSYIAEHFYPLPLRERWNMAAAIMLTLYEGVNAPADDA